MTFGLRILKYACILRMLLFHLKYQAPPFLAPRSDSAVHFLCLGIKAHRHCQFHLGGLHAISSSLFSITVADRDLDMHSRQ